MSDKNFIWYEKISSSDSRIVGETALDFRAMIDENFPVPLGFVVTFEAYENFIKGTGISEEIKNYLSDLDADDEEELEETSEKIRDLILETEIPEDIEEGLVSIYRDLCDRVGEIDAPVLFRTSVYVEDEEEGSLPEQEATCLGVNGEEDLLKHLKQSWAFKFSDQILSHFNERGYSPDQVLISISVQRMIDADKGGLFFTSHPSTGEDDKMVVEANWGLGETVVSGTVTPDTYVLDKENGAIIDNVIGSKEEMLVHNSMECKNERKQTATEKREAQVVNEEEANEMVALGKRLEEYYDEPQEVEWAKEGDEIYLVHSKPMEFVSQESSEEEVEESVEEEIGGGAEGSDFSKMSESVVSPTVTGVKVNISSPEDAKSVAESTRADGVGLLKAEKMVSDEGKHPVRLIDEGGEGQIKKGIKEGVRKSVESFSSDPVWYRTLDLSSEELSGLSGGKTSNMGSNPKMGLRGARKFVKTENFKEQEVLKTELRAIRELVEDGFDNLGVMISMVQSPQELERFKIMAREVGLEPHEDFKVGIMVELPAAALIIDKFIEEGVDFVSFDPSVLTQFTLGVDKDNEEVEDLYDEGHPAVERLLGEAIEKCRENDVEAGVYCGPEISSDLVEKLVRYGVKSISVDPDFVQNVRRIIGKIEKEIILERAREELDN